MFFIAPPLPHDHPPHPASEIACRFSLVFETLFLHLAANLPLLGRFAMPAWRRLQATHQRVLAILARIAAGTYAPPRARRPDAPRPGGRPAPYLPRRRFWLAIAGYQVRNVASQLRATLAAPENLAILAQATPHARLALGRALRTTCRMLDIDLPAILTPAGPPPPRPRPSRAPPRAIRPSLPPLRPLQPYVRAAVRAWKPRYG